MPKQPTVTAGKAGEDAAVKLLQTRGYKIIARNFRSKVGELDIIAIDGNTLVFVEVKTRWSRDYGYPEEAITPKKLQSIMKTAEYFKLTHPSTPDLQRIDAVAIEVDGERIIRAELIKNISF
jgi:putative endonuclease